jgi:hypothetical protein
VTITAVKLATLVAVSTFDEDIDQSSIVGDISCRQRQLPA